MGHEIPLSIVWHPRASASQWIRGCEALGWEGGHGCRKSPNVPTPPRLSQWEFVRRKEGGWGGSCRTPDSGGFQPLFPRKTGARLLGRVHGDLRCPLLPSARAGDTGPDVHLAVTVSLTLRSLGGLSADSPPRAPCELVCATRGCRSGRRARERMRGIPHSTCHPHQGLGSRSPRASCGSEPASCWGKGRGGDSFTASPLPPLAPLLAPDQAHWPFPLLKPLQ